MSWDVGFVDKAGSVEEGPADGEVEDVAVVAETMRETRNQEEIVNSSGRGRDGCETDKGKIDSTKRT